MDVEEEIARIIDKALDDWQGDESEPRFVAARIMPLLNRVRAEAWRQGHAAGRDYIEQNSEGKAK